MRTILPLLLALLLPATAAATSSHAAVEIVPFGGYSATSLDADTFIGTTGARDGALFGLAVAVALRRSLLLEARWTHQETEITFDPGFLAIYLPDQDLDIDTIHLGLQKRWALDARLTPFLTLSVGGAQLRSAALTRRQKRFDAERFSAALGAGFKIDLLSHVGLQFEGRGVWIDLPPELGDRLLQLTLNTGVIFRF